MTFARPDLTNTQLPMVTGPALADMRPEHARSNNERRHSGPTPLSFHLTIHPIERMVADLMPFYGVNCPVSVVLDEQGPERRVVQGTLATIEGWLSAAPRARSMQVFVG